MGPKFFQADHILMCFICISAEFYHCNCNIGTMVCHALQIGQNVIINKADGKRAITILHSLHMAELHLIAKYINVFFQRLNFVLILLTLFNK